MRRENLGLYVVTHQTTEVW